MALNVGSIIGFVGADNSAYLDAVDETIRAGERMAKTMERQLKSVGRSMESLGRTMSIAVTAPILAATGAMTKAAVDANETRNKFNVVFRDIAKDANETAEVLKESFGLGSTESRKLLGDTGDLLTGFGFTQKAALDMSNQVQKLAVDLASFTNVEGGTTRASKALTAALLGEAEQVKALGIVIRQDSDEYKALVSQGMSLLGLSRNQAKAQAALTIAISQSSNAIGDYGRTAGETANQQRLFWTRVKDSAEAIGQRLIPALDRSLVIGFKLLDMWNSLGTALQDQILQYTLLAAAVGPTLLVVGGLVSAAGTLFGILGTGLGVLASLTTGFLAFTPIVIGVALGVALFLDAFGSLLPSAKSIGGAFVWLQGIWKDTVDFWSGAIGNILGNTKTLTEGQRKAVEFIAKVWLSLKFAWNSVVVGLQSILQTITIALDGLLFNMERLARFAKMKGLADSINGVREGLQNFVVDVEDAKEANLKAMKEITDSWGKAPDMLKEDVEAFKIAVSEIGEQALEGIRGLAPEAVEKVRGLIAEINNALAAGEVGAVQIPVEYGTEQFGPGLPPIMPPPGAEFGPGTKEGIEAFFEWRAQAEFEAMARVNNILSEGLTENQTIWELFQNSNLQSLEGWRENVAGVYSGLRRGISDSLAATLVSGKSFGKSMVSVFQTMGQRLLSLAIENALARIAINEAVTLTNAAKEAPSPFAIPLFVGIAAAAFSSILSGTSFGGASSNTGGGASVAPPAVTSQVATVSKIEDDRRNLEPDRGSGLLRVVLEEDGFGQFLSLAVKETKNGRGDGDDRLALASDLGT